MSLSDLHTFLAELPGAASPSDALPVSSSWWMLGKPELKQHYEAVTREIKRLSLCGIPLKILWISPKVPRMEGGLLNRSHFQLGQEVLWEVLGGPVPLLSTVQYAHP